MNLKEKVLGQVNQAKWCLCERRKQVQQQQQQPQQGAMPPVWEQQQQQKPQQGAMPPVWEQQQQQQQKPQQGAMPPVWELAQRLQRLDKQKLPKQKNLTVNKRDELLKHLLLEHKIKQAKEEESSPRPMKEEKVKENKAAIQQKERIRNLPGENHRVQHGKNGEVPGPGAALGQLLHRGGSSKGDDLEGY